MISVMTTKLREGYRIHFRSIAQPGFQISFLGAIGRELKIMISVNSANCIC